jgi:hypothetical protein
MDERRPVGRYEHHVGIADDHATGRVAGGLREDGRCARLDQLAAHATLEPYARALHVGARRSEDVDRLRVVDDLDADLLQEGVGVVLDRFETLGRDDLDRRQLPGQVGE